MQIWMFKYVGVEFGFLIDVLTTAALCLYLKHYRDGVIIYAENINGKKGNIENKCTHFICLHHNIY